MHIPLCGYTRYIQFNKNIGANQVACDVLKGVKTQKFLAWIRVRCFDAQPIMILDLCAHPMFSSPLKRESVLGGSGAQDVGFALTGLEALRCPQSKTPGAITAVFVRSVLERRHGSDPQRVVVCFLGASDPPLTAKIAAV